MKQISKYSGSIIWGFLVILSIAAQNDHLMSVLVNTFYLPYVSVTAFLFMLFAEKLLTKRNAFDMMYTRLKKNKQPKQTINKGNHNEKNQFFKKHKQKNQQIQANRI